MKTRALASVCAWCLGVAGATSGTVVAVSLIGQGIDTSPVRTLSVGEVASALAGMSRSPGPSGDPAADPASGASAPAGADAAPSGSAPPSAAGAATSAPRTLTSSGGSVIAVCTAAGAYLSSWSPAQGYQVAAVRRGPAPIARVVFQSGASRAYLGAVCHAGVPTAVYGQQTESESPDD